MKRKKIKIQISKDDIKNFPLNELKPDSFWAPLYEEQKIIKSTKYSK